MNTRLKVVPCPLGEPAGRWSTNYDEHYNWCRSVRDRTVDEENVARDTQANACFGDHDRCNGYADRAIAQGRRVDQLGCARPATAEGRWSDNTDQHYNWCRQAIRKSATVDHEVDQRETMVTRCARCDQYAHGAVATATRLFQDGCGNLAYGEGRWSRDVEAHRAWCLSAREGSQNGEDREREKGLAACQAQKRGIGSAPDIPPTRGPEAVRKVLATLDVTQCNGSDGAPSEYFDQTHLPTACAVDEETAEAHARLFFNGEFGDGPDQCQYEAQFTRGVCPCTLPPGQARSGLSDKPWATWNAFATNCHGGWGYAMNQPDLATANRLAMDGCGGRSNACSVFGTSTSLCSAFAESRQGGYWFAAGGGPTEEVAKAAALRFCQSGSAPPGTCQIAYSGC